MTFITKKSIIFVNIYREEHSMKNILIVSHGMEIGGAESSLLGLLSSIDYSYFNVDLFLYNRSGDLLKYIPEEVNILDENPKYASIASPVSTIIKNKALLVLFGKIIGKIKTKIEITKYNPKEDCYFSINNNHKFTHFFLPVISKKEYDLAISFLTPHYFVLKKCKAKRKIAWIHTDYSAVEIAPKSELKMWSKYDNIISISEKVSESFLKVFPSLNDKIEIIENIHPADFIKKRAEEFQVTDEMPDDGFIKLLSVGRYCFAKNFDNIPEICKKIPNAKWYIIGYGTDENIIKNKIHEFNMEDRVILLGKKENPYPYFKKCDFYVQPSRYEGNAVTVNEALILGKKVIISNYSTSSCQIDNGINGIIVPQDNDGCAQAITDYINNTDLQKRIENNVLNSDFSKSAEIEKLKKFTEN